MLTDAEWRGTSKTFVQEPPPADGALDGCSRQIKTFPSYEDEAKMVPNFGCA
jgi:hypothetical protein